jgi:hypothetical protein
MVKDPKVAAGINQAGAAPSRPARGGIPVLGRAAGVPVSTPPQVVPQTAVGRAPERQLELARRHGAVIENGRLIPHPDGQGLLHHTGFALPTFRDDPVNGTSIPYRDDHGRQHQIGVEDMRRVTDPGGKTNYHFQVNGQPVSVPEGETPLFQVDKDGRRFTQAADGTRRELGYDRNAAAQAGVAPREAAAGAARAQALAEGADLTRRLQEKQAQAAAAQQRLSTAQKTVDAMQQASTSYGPEAQVKPSWEQQTAARQELMDAHFANESHAQELQALQKQHDDHYSAFVHSQRARQAEIGRYKSVAAESPADAPWQRDARTAHGDTRSADLNLITEAEKKDPATAAAMRRALLPQPTRRLLDAADKSFGAAEGGQPPAEGKSMSLHDMLMQAPEMKLGGWKTVDQAEAARSTAQHSLGIADPEKVRVARGADGSYSLTRKAADGSGADQPLATLDPRTQRITLAAGPDGKPTQAAIDMAAQGSPNGTPMYLPGGQPPLSAEEVSGLISQGLKATGSTTDRRQADAALTQAGLSPDAISKLVQQGRLSVQDGQLLNNKFNGGATSYADRDKAETAQRQEAGMQQMYQDAKGTKDKPNFESWLDKGDPQRDAQVQAKAKELGKSEDDVRRHLETQRIADWGTPLSQASHDQQSGLGYGLARKLGAIGLAEPTRTLPNGDLMPNPELGGDRAKFDAAINGAIGSKEAKEKARGLWDKYHDNYLSNVRSTLETMEKLPGAENYTAWRERMHKEGKVSGLSENQKAEKYLAEQKGRPWYTKLADTVGSNFIAGSHDLVAGIAGTAGLLTGSQTASDFAAEKAGQAERSTAALQYTGSDGLLHNLVGGLARAAPGAAASAATGGAGGAAAMAFTQGAGGTYADLYKRHTDEGMTPEQAHQASFKAAAASGAVSAALSGIFPGGANALNNPAAREAAKKSFGSVMKSFLKGAADEVPQEVIDSGFSHMVSEMNKGKTAKEAAASFIEQLPETMATAGVMGGAVQAGADIREGSRGASQSASASPTGYVDPSIMPNGKQSFNTVDAEGREVVPPGSPEQPRRPGVPITPTAMEGQVIAGQSSARTPIPQTTTRNDTGSGQPLQTTANNSKPSQTSPPPAANLTEVGQVLDNIKRLQDKAKDGPLSQDEQRELDHNEKVLAQTRVKNLEKEQQVTRSLPNPRELDPVKTKALADAKAVLARPAPGEPSSSSHSRGGGETLGTTAATNGGTPLEGHGTGTQAPAFTANEGEKDKKKSDGSLHVSAKDELAAIRSDLKTFSEGWSPPAHRILGEISQGSNSTIVDDEHTDSFGSKSSQTDDELPYWTEYYNEVGRQKDNLEPLLESIRAHSATLTKNPNHLGIQISEGEGSSYDTIKRHGKVVGHIITHGPSTKKWEILEEFAHYRANQGWKSKEIKTLTDTLKKGVPKPGGGRQYLSNEKAVAEEIIIKQHLLENVTSLSNADRRVIQNQINQLYRYGFRRKY